jgi:hypothetical protein
MSDLASNPIYKRVVEGSRGPSPGVCLLIGVGVAAMAFPAGYILSTIPYRSPASSVLTVSIGLALFLPLAVLSVVTIASARLAAIQVADEGFALVRISGLGAAEIGVGLIRGVRYRFRLWRSLCAGLVAFLLIVFAVLLGLVGPGGDIIQTRPELIIIGSLLGAAVALYYYFAIWPMFLTAGVWSALRSRGNFLLIAGGVALVPLVYLLLAFFLVFEVFPAGRPGAELFRALLIICGVAILAPYPLMLFLEADIKKLLERERHHD